MLQEKLLNFVNSVSKKLEEEEQEKQKRSVEEVKNDLTLKLGISMDELETIISEENGIVTLRLPSCMDIRCRSTGYGSIYYSATGSSWLELSDLKYIIHRSYLREGETNR